LAARLSTFGPTVSQKKSEKGGPKKQKSGHGPEKADRVRTFFHPDHIPNLGCGIRNMTLIWGARFEI